MTDSLSGTRTFAIAALAFLFLQVAIAGSPPAIRLPVSDATDLRFRRVSFEIGPSHSRVGQIAQDNRGFLWFGTHDGLERYDGYTFRPYRHDPSNPNSLSGSNIYGLFKDRSGKLWVGSDKYLDRFDPATETFTHLQPDPATFEGWVSRITQDRDGTLWLCTNHGLNRLDPKTFKTVRYQHTDGDPSTLSSNLIRATLEGADGTFWVATTEGVDVFDRRSGKVTGHFPLPERTAAERPHSEVSLCEDHTGAVWVAFSFGDGLAVVDRRANKLIYYSFGAPSSDSAPLPGVRTIFEDEDGSLWLGSASWGILRLDRDRQRFVRYRYDPSDVDSLSSDQIVAMLEDHEGNIWAGTTGGGVNWFPRKPLPFRRYRHEAGNPNSLPMDYTSAIYADRSGYLWVGSVSALTRIQLATGQFTFYRKVGGAGNLSSAWVVSIAEDRAGNLWFGTIDGGLNRLDPRTGKFKAYRHDPRDDHSLSNDTVLALFVDHTGAVWAGTEDGLCRFDAKTERFDPFKAPDGRIRYRGIAEDPQGILWLGTLETGLRSLDPATGKFTIYTHTAAAGSLSSAQVNTVYVDHSGTVWAGTQNGLDRFDRTKGTFTGYYERDGLPNNSMNSILEDEAGHLWVSTGGGLCQFDPRTLTFKNYHASDGLLGDEFYNYASASKAPSGEMFFNSYAGVISFFPARVLEKPVQPRVVITDLLLFGKPVSVGNESPLKQPVAYTSEIALSHSQSIFSLEFSGLSYASPEELRYRFKLEGLETEWNETGATYRSATYTTLAPRGYTFLVQARANRGIWTQPGASLRIVVLPPWWNTWWFRIALLAGTILLLGSLHRFRLRAVERHNRDLAAQVLERTRAEQEIKALSERLIGAQEEERTRIARELHDDVSQQIAALSISLSNLRSAEPDQRFADELAGLRQRVISISNFVRKLSHELHPAILEYSDLATVLRGFCAEFSKLNNLNVSFSSDGSFNDLPSPVALCLYRVTQEALRNVAKHSSATQANVRLARMDGQVVLTVSDNGVGFSPSQAQASGGLGLVSMKERIRLVNGIFECGSQPNHGTTVTAAVNIVSSLNDASIAGSSIKARRNDDG